MGNYCTIKLREKMAEVANSKAYLSYDDRTMSIKVNKFERNYSEKSHFIVTKKLRDYLDNAISSQIPNLGSVFTMEVSNSGYYVYARPSAEQMNKVNSFGKQLKDQEEVREHILLNQESGNQYFDDEGNVLSKDDYLTYKGQNIQPVDISTLSKETQKVFEFLKENFHRIANNLDIFNDQDIWDEIVGKTKWKNSGGIFTIHDETGQLGIFLNPKKQNPETFPHELLHAFTEIILNDPQTKKEHDFVNLVNDLYEEFKNTPNSKNLNRGYQYKDISEFLVYSLTNTEMQEFIKNNENKKISNLYEKVIYFFKKLFGLNDSQFEKLFKSLKLAVNDSDYNNIKERSLSILKNIKRQENSDNVPLIKADVEKLFNENESLANSVYEALGFNNLRKEYSNIIIDQVWKRLANEGITNADSLIGTRDTINNKDFNKFWSAVKDIDIQNVINFFKSEKQKALNSFNKYKGEFDTTTGTFTSNDTSFFDKKIEDLETLLQQKQQAQQLYSSYLQTTNNPTIEGFKQWNNRQQQINKLFESNPDFSSQIYEALGFETNNSLENKLKAFFNQFGFQYKEGESSTDLLNKIIYTSKKDNSVFIDNSVKALSQLLLANTNIDFHKLESLIEDTPEFKKLLSNSSDYLKTTHKFLKDGNRIPMEEWISYIKDYNKIKNEVLEKYLKESLLDNKNSTKLHKLINDFLKWFKDLFANAKNLKDVTDSLIQQVLMNQKEVIINSKDLQNKERVTLAKALEETTHGKDIIKTFGDFGLILTGSVSAAEQGSVFRKTGKLLHDIDWVVPKGFTKDFNKTLKDAFPGSTLVREFDSSTYYTHTYIVPPKGYTISNLTFFKPEVYGERKYIASYDVLDKNGNIVSNYRRYYDIKESGKVVENREVYNEGLKNVDKNLEAISVDFFQNKEDLKYEPYTVNIEGVNLQLSNWLSSFTEKLKYGRAKDLLDYANFIPNDVIPSITTITVEQKQEAQKLYSQYLDQIFPDSKVEEIDDSLYNSVLNQLEQENIIEKDCSGGKLKAEKGFVTNNFTKNSKWKLIEEFDGKSHTQGGIDIKLTDKGFTFKNGNTPEIKAKFGLLIPNKK